MQFRLRTAFLVIVSFAMGYAIFGAVRIESPSNSQQLFAILLLVSTPLVWSITGVVLSSELLPNDYSADSDFWFVFIPTVVYVVYLMLVPWFVGPS